MWPVLPVIGAIFAGLASKLALPNGAAGTKPAPPRKKAETYLGNVARALDQAVTRLLGIKNPIPTTGTRRNAPNVQTVVLEPLIDALEKLKARLLTPRTLRTPAGGTGPATAPPGKVATLLGSIISGMVKLTK